MRVGIVGFGRQGQRRAGTIYGTQPAAEIGVYDVSGEALASIPLSYKGFPVLLRLVEWAEVLVLSTTTSSHMEMLRELIPAGKPILVEKPLVTSTREAQEVIELARRYRTPIHVGLNNRYRDPVIKAKSLLAEIGQVHRVRAFMSHYEFGRGENPRAKGTGGPLLDLGTHLLDLISWLLEVKVGKLDFRTGEGEFDSEHIRLVLYPTEGLGEGREVECYIEAAYDEPRMGAGCRIELIGTLGQLRIVMNGDLVPRQGEGDYIETIIYDPNPARRPETTRQTFDYPDKCWKRDNEAFFTLVESSKDPKFNVIAGSNLLQAAWLVALLSIKGTFVNERPTTV